MKCLCVLRRCIPLLIFTAALCLGSIGSAGAEVDFRVGLLSEPSNMNPFGATDTWTQKVIGLIYQPLYRLDPDTMKLIPWLAADEPEYDPRAMTLTFRLREMQWDDGTPFTAEDVVFTAETVKRFRIPGYYSYWKFVSRIEALDKHRVKMTLHRPMATLFTRTLTSWIVQKSKWEPVIRDADKVMADLSVSQPADREGASEKAMQTARQVIQNHMIQRPIGLGPFRFQERKRGLFIVVVKNEHFFGMGKDIAGRKLGPYIDRIVFKIYDSLGSATLALKKGEIDFLWKAISQAFAKDLIQDPDVSVPMTIGRGYRYLGFNLRRPPMSDAAFRRAVAYLIDKDFIVKRILHDHGQRIDSVVPPANVFYYNEQTPTYGKGMDRLKRIRAAYDLLKKAGYGWERPPIDLNGSPRKGSGLRLPDGSPSPALTLMTPTPEYDTEVAAAGRTIAEWLSDFGIPVSWNPMPFNALRSKIRTERDFDMFLLGWRKLSMDPDYLRRFFDSSYDSPDGWNDTGYHNTQFDKMAEQQAETLDPAKRARIIRALQELVMTDLPYIPLYIPHMMEAIRTDRFEGWTMQFGGVGNIWTFCLLRPTPTSAVWYELKNFSQLQIRRFSRSDRTAGLKGL